MLETEYERSLNHNYLIVKQNDNTGPNYKDEMLIQNVIEGILPVSVRRLNNKKLYCYDVTGTAGFGAVFESRKISGEQLKKILLSVLNTISNASKYLLEEDDFILLPEQIFVHIIELEAKLCYLPGYGKDIRVQFQKLLEYFMNQIKYEEQETVVLVYSLYMKSKEQNWGFVDFNNILKQFKIENQGQEMKREDITLCKRDLSRDEAGRFAEDTDKKEREVEKLYYPIKSYLIPSAVLFIVFLVLFVSFKTKFIYNDFGTKIDTAKLLPFTVLGAAAVVFSVLDSFSKKRLCSKMERTTTDDAIIREKGMKEKNQTKQTFGDVYGEYYEENTDTILLCDNNDNREVLLIPAKDTEYDKIILNEFPFFVGKLKLKADACIENPKVSKIHAKINQEDNMYYLYDLNSTNGTFINGLCLPVNGKGILRNGDLISFADADYIFSCPSSADMIKSKQ